MLLINSCFNTDIPDYDINLVKKVLNSDVTGLKEMLDKKEVTSV